MRTVDIPDSATLRAAAEVVGRLLPPTPVVLAPTLGEHVVLKLESFQPTGAFKVRGGLAAVAAALARSPGPLVTASAGNHGLGLAYAADLLGADATVVVAETASEAKVRSIGRFSVRLVRHGSGYDEAEAHALELARQIGGRYISPYNDPDVIAGQSTIGTELLEQVPGLGTILVPVGGGGLLSGIGLATAGRDVRIVGIEPDRSTAMGAAIAAGGVVPVCVGQTMADGLAGNIEAGSVTVDLARRFAADMLTVSEEEIAGAMRHLAYEYGLVAEGSGAVAVAALLAGRVKPEHGPVVALVTGRNISPPLLAAVLAH